MVVYIQQFYRALDLQTLSLDLIHCCSKGDFTRFRTVLNKVAASLRPLFVAYWFLIPRPQAFLGAASLAIIVAISGKKFEIYLSINNYDF